MSHFPSVDHEKLANEFITFMNESCTAFHAVVAAKTRLLAAGFIELYEQDEWSLHANGKYFFIRNSTTIMAFAVGGNTYYSLLDTYMYCNLIQIIYSITSC